MKGPSARPRLRRFVAVGVAVTASAALVASCTRPPGGGGTTTQPPTTPPTTDGHGHTEHDHANQTSTTMDPGMDHGDGGHGHESPARLNHPPTANQKKWAEDLVAYTKTALKQIPNKQAAIARGYNDIGDGQHFTHPKYRVDQKELDPRYIESLVFNRLTGTIQAAMYNMEPTTTAANVYDYAGNWVVWHGHDNLCWRAPENRPDLPGWTQLGGVKINGQCTMGSYAHTPVPMLHVWITDTTYENKCGAFASIDGLGPGACVQSFQQNNIPARPIPASFPYKPVG
jgi:hypothetical protein